MHSQMVIFIFNIDTRFIIYKCFLQYFTLDYKKILPPFSADIQCLLDINVLTSINFNIQFSLDLHSSLSKSSYYTLSIKALHTKMCDILQYTPVHQGLLDIYLINLTGNNSIQFRADTRRRSGNIWRGELEGR